MSDENAETKEKLNWQRLLITAGIVLVTAVAVGGTVWYLMDKNAKSVADSNTKSISALQKQVNELKNAPKSKSEIKPNSDVASSTVVSSGALNEALIANGTYTIGGKTFTMVNGVFTEGENRYEFQTPYSSSRSSLIESPDTAAAVVKMTTGGTGVFKYLVVIKRIDGKAKSVASLELGDRPVINSLSLSGVKVTLDITVAGPNDPSCCPTQRETRIYNIINNELVRA